MLGQSQKPETDQAPSVQPTETEPDHKSEKSEDSLRSWDGPVWDSRYGRFESQEDVAVDDRKGRPPPSSLLLQRHHTQLLTMSVRPEAPPLRGPSMQLQGSLPISILCSRHAETYGADGGEGCEARATGRNTGTAHSEKGGVFDAPQPGNEARRGQAL